MNKKDVAYIYITHTYTYMNCVFTIYSYTYILHTHIQGYIVQHGEFTCSQYFIIIINGV